MDEKEAMTILDELFAAQDVLRKHYGSNVVAIHASNIHVQPNLFKFLPGEPIYKGRNGEYFVFVLEVGERKITCLM